jgi:hypothetical protein
VWQISMRKNPSLVKEERPFGKGDVWIQVTSLYFAFKDFRTDPDGIECLRVPTVPRLLIASRTFPWNAAPGSEERCGSSAMDPGTRLTAGSTSQVFVRLSELHGS